VAIHSRLLWSIRATLRAVIIAFSSDAYTKTSSAVMCQQALGRTLPLLALADKASTARHFSTANKLLDSASRAFGNADYRRGVLDDTDLYLGVAEIQQREGKLELAVKNKRGILVKRLAVCGYPPTPPRY